jgi:hypothetical protein
MTPPFPLARLRIVVLVFLSGGRRRERTPGVPTGGPRRAGTDRKAEETVVMIQDLHATILHGVLS